MTAVAITGMHRAGTSMVAHALSRAGVHLGSPSRMLPPAPDNPEGFFEHAGFVRLADDVLEACGAAWDHLPDAAPFGADDPRVAASLSAARELLAELEGAPVWGWKDPRTCLTAAFWADLVPDLRIVVCVRNPLEVAVSLRRRNGTSYLHALWLWRGYYAAVLDAVPPGSRILTHYDAHLADPARELARIAAFAGLSATPANGAELDVVDRGKRHHQLDIALADAGVGDDVVALYERLCDEAGFVPPAVSAPPVALDRRAVELAIAQQSLERYGRYVAGLQKDLAEQTGRVGDLEAAGNGAVLAELTGRLDALEDAQHDARYDREDLSAHPHADAVRAGRRLVRAHVPRREQVLVLGDDPALLDICGRPTAAIGTLTIDDDLAAVARLESSRLGGAGYLLVPEPVRPWLDRRPGFADHVTGRYRIVATDGGLLVDLRARAAASEGWPASVSAAVERLVPGAGADPAILDWSQAGLAELLPGRNVFVPPEGDALPYLERSVDLVVIRDPDRLDEARRVASRAVITLADDPRPRVHDVELVEALPPDVPPVIRYVTAGDPDPVWRRLFAEAVGQQVEILADDWTPADLAGSADVIAVAEPGVLPLPGCAAAAGSTLEAGSTGAVAVKVLDGRGRLDAAGATVFADGSWAGIAAGLPRHEAWHEYVREVCGGSGLLYLDAALVPSLDAALMSHDPHPMVWAAAVWQAGHSVRYQPAAVAVRAIDLEEPDPLAGVVAAAWGPALAFRPVRPEPLDPRAWRALLARDDIEGAWR